jgi:hypothetical protein
MPKKPRSAGWRLWAITSGMGRRLRTTSTAASAPTRNTAIRTCRNRLHRALTRLNPALPAAAIFDAYQKLLRVEAPTPLARNRTLHRMLVEGVNVEYARSDGSIVGAQAMVIDFDNPEHNHWLAVTSSPSAAEPPRGYRDLCQRIAARRHRAEKSG